jgi:hypothetical protein
MLREKNMHPYQRFSVESILKNPSCGLFLDMGLGKTVSTLTAINVLIYERFEVSRVLVIAPKRVARDTWADEVRNWEHLRHLRVAVAVGDARTRVRALQSTADVYCINRENVPWMVAHFGGKLPFDCLVIDELSSFKNNDTVRFKALRKVRPFFKRVIGLTGTPVPNGYMDLWAQIYLLDGGKRLGEFITHYRDRFFEVDPATAYGGYPKLVPRAGAAETIQSLIAGIHVPQVVQAVVRLGLVRPLGRPGLRRRHPGLCLAGSCHPPPAPGAECSWHCADHRAGYAGVTVWRPGAGGAGVRVSDGWCHGTHLLGRPTVRPSPYQPSTPPLQGGVSELVGS